MLKNKEDLFLKNDKCLRKHTHHLVIPFKEVFQVEKLVRVKPGQRRQRRNVLSGNRRGPRALCSNSLPVPVLKTSLCAD